MTAFNFHHNITRPPSHFPLSVYSFPCHIKISFHQYMLVHVSFYFLIIVHLATYKHKD